MRRFFGVVIIIFFLNACQNQPSLTRDEEDRLSMFKRSVSDYLEDSDPDSAMHLAKSTLDIRHKIDDPSVIYNAYVQMGKIFDYKQHFDSALFYYQEAYDFVKDDDNLPRKAKALHWMGDVHISLKDYDKAGEYLKQAMLINRQQKLLLPLATNYALLGLNFKATYQYDSSLVYYYLAESVFDSLNDLSRSATVLSNISDVYRKIEDYNNALLIMKKALAIHDSIGNVREAARIQNTIGIIYKNLQLYDSAISCYRQAIPNAESVGYDFVALIARFNMAEAFSLKGNYGEANPILEEIYQFCYDNGIAEGQIRCLLRKGINQLSVKKYSEARILLEKGLKLAEENGDLDLQGKFLSELLKLEFQESENPIPESYYTKMKQIEDSLNMKEQKLKIAEIENKYQNQQKQLQIAVLERENTYQKNRSRIIIILAIAVIILAIALFLYFRNRHILLRQKHSLSVNENKLKQISLEKAALESQLKDEMISSQNQSINQKIQQLVYSTLSQSRLIELNHMLTEKLTPLSFRQKTKGDKQLIEELLMELNRVNNREPLKEFEKLFNELHPDFYPAINNKFPDITPRELQICALLSLNLQTKDISNITNISVTSLETIRYRIRKKMGLSTDQNLAVELMSATP